MQNIYDITISGKGKDGAIMISLAKLFGRNSDKNELHIEQNLADEVAENECFNEVKSIPINEISPNPFQPRKTFDDDALHELASSIREYGIIQPLLVRRINFKYELIAGERRLRASKLVGLAEVPVIIKDLSDKEMAELALIENLQREDFHYLEEAQGFQQLIANFGLTQEELAKRVGKNQSTIANKMRLLKLSSEIQNLLVKENLTERHARALLKIEDHDVQNQVIKSILEKKLNVRETEELIDSLIQDAKEKKTPRQNVVKVIKDVRIFINTINSVVGDMKKLGINVMVSQEQNNDYIIINMRVPKKK